MGPVCTCCWFRLSGEYVLLALVVIVFLASFGLGSCLNLLATQVWLPVQQYTKVIICRIFQKKQPQNSLGPKDNCEKNCSLKVYCLVVVVAVRMGPWAVWLTKFEGMREMKWPLDRLVFHPLAFVHLVVKPFLLQERFMGAHL